ncbi:hypothetical protein MSG28_014334 [Choristoneura fumiferana]|uniref:Uncharacterized protein n=1 Tax=Choristoneura fumiferana TaxID=7141 RepID=A0ACC0JGV0_CHOFU|nr:hypothetical protein MSG28_014334 [Choristoneura fumiferana]
MYKARRMEAETKFRDNKPMIGPEVCTTHDTVLFTLGAIAVWLTEYFLRLQHNVMSDEDLANTWNSDGTADLGLSFWLVVAAAITAFANNVCILVAMADERDADTVAPALEEKVNGAIMLY